MRTREHENDSEVTGVENRSQILALFRFAKIREEIGEMSESFVCARPEGPNSAVLLTAALRGLGDQRYAGKKIKHNSTI